MKSTKLFILFLVTVLAGAFAIHALRKKPAQAPAPIVKGQSAPAGETAGHGIEPLHSVEAGNHAAPTGVTPPAVSGGGASSSTTPPAADPVVAQASTLIVPGSTLESAGTALPSGRAVSIVPDGSDHLPGKQAAGQSQTHGGVTLEVPTGARVPIAAMEGGGELTPQQQVAVDEILQDFKKEIVELQTAGEGGAASANDAWEAARKRADERYRILFGDAAYNAMQIQAAREALAEKQRQADGTTGQ